MLFENVVAKIASPHPLRELAKLQYIIVHRIGWNDNAEWVSRGYTRDALGVAAFYKKEMSWSMPYTFTVGHGGLVQQARQLADVTPHALRFNREAIGIGFLGDFRFLPPEDKQWAAGVELISLLVRAWPHLLVKGHTEMGDEATQTPGKSCPGKCFDLNKLRREVAAVQYREGIDQLRALGVSI